jgi:hypothetical protein
MENIEKLWIKYNDYANKLSNALGRTNNIVGEYAEYVACKYCNGELLAASHPSADIKDQNGKLYQVKSRKLKNTQATQLGIIRSWHFDFLLVILFDKDGVIPNALKVPVETAKKYAKENKHQNGWVITTNQDFLTDTASKNITNYFNH